MKTISIAFVFLGGSLVLAQSGIAAAAGYHRGQTRRMKAELVSADATAATITVRNLAEEGKFQPEPGSTAEDNTGNQTVLRVEGWAVSRLGALQTGDSVVLTCRSGRASTDLSKIPASAPALGASPACLAVTGIQRPGDITRTPRTQRPQR